MAFSKICDDRGKLGKGQKETGAKGRKREETRREGMGLFGFLSLPRAAKKKGVAVGRWAGSVTRKEKNLGKNN